VHTGCALALGHLLEQGLYFLGAHVELLIVDLSDAFPELVQGHHLHLLRVDEALEQGLVEVAAVHDRARQPKHLWGHELHLGDALELLQKRAVPPEFHAARVQSLGEEVSLPGSQLYTQTGEGEVEVGLLELAEVLPVEGLKDRAHREREVFLAREPGFQGVYELLHVGDV
jgi:hypothetical protein